MKVLIIYDSQFGNTEKIAQAIAKNIPSAKLLQISKTNLEDLNNVTLLIVGSPTQGGRATVPLQQFLDQIPAGKLTKVKVAVFDTRFGEKNVNFVLKIIIKTFNYAAPKIAEILEDKGGNLIVPPEGFIVTNKEGPLANNELERAMVWAKKLQK
ncbi:hypothetical protein A2422_03820 [Candidatus Woesebacteria bacterium RIFOXYC1_FULL_31_51]|uniref:Flavodoxin/nitric oxide synthase n=1 Tax=Candidatus Woesebacteria bacterium GW2011_GWC2_31_9 TaxID=1618586 RepID=A0A0G0BLX0_9BACT|nr:MAG: flavodoxin/nitric oxide synthase [Candidatus Woesebacteria bacterium GW2011_GWF1_31_35]KKP23170.1 MAG: Flavodoxin/nitric oxide synthase [Candidatus Woesebacteria bacterium GW2011_GWC1_30_29]KKP26858.1 MAG: Flavodoxin/nitric oxide synthase [Candidatus Woesebacteria bacterium GW2011_GWD1_31_12]KKP27432.1 MAG: Flavodoxin/nitric oxide synthase [Candidatus Woesebacteria bacterium GW2011_GWB1_31_29]KKP32052.1 MAG: Flavodoxin/nitric oxide synthase [Candidatus Woesebacteria bacterium GW2011_GWC